MARWSSLIICTSLYWCIWRYCTSKMLAIYILPFMVIVRICVLYLIIIVKSEVWPVCHWIELGHETMLCALCLSTLFQYTVIYTYHILNYLIFTSLKLIIFLPPCTCVQAFSTDAASNFSIPIQLNENLRLFGKQSIHTLKFPLPSSK